ncbi:AraC-type DNA-binding protein [Zunongwangia mangrovi]|uniref:AraC-type DNA-binding protein n=1 Tax=Zunongwangia mangrovi TaxID=1334022 RepID=A0A1I1MX22_9FLAO|nr:AraC family transcriptional regulator [Zunongwangia mangrovi]SFC87798.1 AraC-type DNA-binding protein [Zunongwangia mangrovi]
MDNHSENKKVKEGFIGQRMVTTPPNIKIEILNNPLIKDFYTTAIGYYPQAHYHDRKRKTGSKEYILLYCVEGKGSVELADNTYFLPPNSFIIIPPDIAHHYRSSINNPWTIFWCHFLGDKGNLLYQHYKRKSNFPVISIPRSERRQKNFIKVMNVLESGYDIYGIEFANLSLFNTVMEMIYYKDINTTEVKADIISNSINYLNSNLDKNIKIEFLAEKYNLSVSRYSEIFKKKTGYSPIQFFNKLKIEKSCQYLYFTDLRVKEICNKIGYEDPYYYSRAFKKLMGMSPSKYRKEYHTPKKSKTS